MIARYGNALAPWQRWEGLGSQIVPAPHRHATCCHGFLQCVLSTGRVKRAKFFSTIGTDKACFDRFIGTNVRWSTSRAHLPQDMREPNGRRSSPPQR
jgi:hypothetical protein